MPCPVCLAFCASNISWIKSLKIFLIFVASFAASFTYLSYSEFTLWTTSLVVSLITSAIFTIGISCNVYLRCAAVLFLIQCFSKFGLAMLFLAVSWMVIQRILGYFITNQRTGLKLIALRGNVSDQFETMYDEYELDVAEGILGFLHYSVLAPFVCIYIYSVLYEITYVTRTTYRRSGRKFTKGKFISLCIVIGNNFVMFIVGFVFSCTLTTFCAQQMSYRNLAFTFQKLGLDVGNLKQITLSWFSFYLIVSFILLVCVPFSSILTKFRYFIIQKHFKINNGHMSCRSEHVYNLKPKHKRLKMVDLKKQRNKKLDLQRKRDAENKNHSINADITNENMEVNQIRVLARNERSESLESVKSVPSRVVVDSHRNADILNTSDETSDDSGKENFESSDSSTRN